METVRPGQGVCFLDLSRCRSRSAEVARGEACFPASLHILDAVLKGQDGLVFLSSSALS